MRKLRYYCVYEGSSVTAFCSNKQVFCHFSNTSIKYLKENGKLLSFKEYRDRETYGGNKIACEENPIPIMAR